MDNNDFLNHSSNNGQYHATTNQNTAMENPQFSMNNVTDINIQNVGEVNNYNANIDSNSIPSDSYTSSFGQYDYQDNRNDSSNNYSSFDAHQSYSSNAQDTSFINVPTYQSNVNGVSDNMVNTQFVPSSSFQNEEATSVSYAPVMDKNKTSQNKITISRELKVTIFIVFILVVFVLLMPYIYDFFKELQLVITG